MKTFPIAALAVLALLAALPGCGRTPTPEAVARADYARIAANADTVLFGDALGYRQGSAAAERVSAVCIKATCSLGFQRAFSGQNFSTDGVDLTLMPARNGVRFVVERGSSDTSDVTVFGGWLEHSFFASQANLFTDEGNPNHGATVLYSYAVGRAAGANPAVAGRAEWRGFVAGREASAVSSLDSVVLGDAVIAVEAGPSGLLADISFTGLANAHTGATWDDMAWTGLAVSSGGFARRDAADDRIEGRFFGPDGEEAGGVFERGGIAGAFGGRRQP